HILRRGNYLRPGAEVKPGFIQILLEQDKDLDLIAGQWKPAGNSSGRRLALAHWLTDTASPAGALVLRVRVNRIWQQLFGKGIVESSDNFGLAGMKPTHPELLEWLATEFVNSGQRLKPFLKLLMTSTVYRQASAQSK